jgi:hypothetical protein
MDLIQAACPGWIRADISVRSWMEVPVISLLVASKDDDRICAGGEIVQEFPGSRELVATSAEFAAKHGGGEIDVAHKLYLMIAADWG